jgi:hypothetical protein
MTGLPDCSAIALAYRIASGLFAISVPFTSKDLFWSSSKTDVTRYSQKPGLRWGAPMSAKLTEISPASCAVIRK